MTATSFARRRAPPHRVCGVPWALWVLWALTGCTSGAPWRAPLTPAPCSAASRQLQLRAAALRDINDIKRLQRAYGYYSDLGQWDQVAKLFSRNATLEIGLDGVYRGQERVRQYFLAVGGGHTGLAPGQVNQYLQLMPVINLAPDGLTAKGTWRAVILAGQAGKGAWWGEGPYENEYVKEGGVWKISALHWYQTLMTPYADGGWARNPDVNGGHYAPASLPPDAPPTEQYKVWPGAHVPHFHFKNQAPSLRTDGAQGSVGTRGDRCTGPTRNCGGRSPRLKHDVQQLEDQNSIEKLQRIYGYYLDKGLWTEAADLFADDGEVEIAGRGDLRGQGSCAGLSARHRTRRTRRRAPVRQHAAATHRAGQRRWHHRARPLASVRADSRRPGQFHEWGVGVYENEYVKRDGVWRIRRLHFYPTLYTPYDAGWAKSVEPYSKFEPDLKPDRPAAAAGGDCGAGRRLTIANPVMAARCPAILDVRRPRRWRRLAPLPRP